MLSPPQPQECSKGLDFILSHFEGPLFPRTISTFQTQNKQVEVFNRENANNLFEYSKFRDCKINAYPLHTEYNGINRQAPNFIFIDLDKSSFKTQAAHKSALNLTLKNMGEKLEGAHPTVLWSGNGYHIYQPMNAEFPLEQNETFSKFNQPSIQFLRFAEQHLSNHKSDPSHNPSFKSCMIRIPGSFNSKCILADGDDNNEAQVKILQSWNKYRPRINLLLGSFYAYLIDQAVESQRQNELNKYFWSHSINDAKILWIEKLLQTPIDDYRKNAVSLILAPYLINIRRLPYEDALNVINNWLMECAKLTRLDNDLSYIVKYALKSSIKSGRKPLKFDTLKLKNAALYDVLNS
jgi:hypothetical protein